MHLILITNYPVFGYFTSFILSYYENLPFKFKNNYSEITFLLVKKKLLDEIIFDVLPLKIYCHLFYCDKGFNAVNICFIVQGFLFQTVAHQVISIKSLLSTVIFLRLIVRIFLLKELLCFSTQMEFFLSPKYSHLKGNYENMGVPFFENVDRPFVLYQFYLEVFSRVVLNSSKKKILPILFKGYSDNSRNEQKCSHLLFQEIVTEKFFRLSSDLVFKCLCYINDIVDADVFHYVFSAYEQKLVGQQLP